MKLTINQLPEIKRLPNNQEIILPIFAKKENTIVEPIYKIKISEIINYIKIECEKNDLQVIEVNNGIEIRKIIK